jgi:putative transposase
MVMKRGSNNRQKAKKVVAKLHAQIGHIRKEFLHQATAKLVKSSSLIA